MYFEEIKFSPNSTYLYTVCSLAHLDDPAERLHLAVVEREAEAAARGDVLLADPHGDHAAGPTPEHVTRDMVRHVTRDQDPPLLRAHVALLADFEESDAGDELVGGGAAVPHPQEPLGRLPHTLHVEQVPAQLTLGPC